MLSSWIHLALEPIGNVSEARNKFYRESQGLQRPDKFLGTMMLSTENLKNAIFKLGFGGYAEKCHHQGYAPAAGY